MFQNLAEDSGDFNSEITLRCPKDLHRAWPCAAFPRILNILCIDAFGHHNSYLGQEGFTPVDYTYFYSAQILVDGRGLGYTEYLATDPRRNTYPDLVDPATSW